MATAAKKVEQSELERFLRLSKKLDFAKMTKEDVWEANERVSVAVLPYLTPILSELVSLRTPTPPATLATGGASEAGGAALRDAQLVELEALEIDATPAPWVFEVKGNSVQSYAIRGVCSGISPKTRHARFICAMRNALPSLLTRLYIAEAALLATPAASEAAPLGGWVAVGEFSQIADGDTLLVIGNIDGADSHLFHGIKKKDTAHDGREVILKKKGNIYFNFDKYAQGTSWVERCYLLPLPTAPTHAAQ